MKIGIDNNFSSFAKDIKKQKNNALGKGLSALLKDVPAATSSNVSENKDHVTLISLAFCVPSRFQARKEFKDDELRELSESIKQHGIIQPVLLRKLGQDSYEIVAGERRCRAAKMAGLTEVPALVKELSDNDLMEVGLIENLQREDLNPREEAQAYKQLMDTHAYTHEKISKTIGKSRSYITNYLRILSLPEEVLSMLSNGDISMGHAKVLVSADNPTQLAKNIVDNSLSVRDLEANKKLSHGINKTSVPKEKFDMGNPDIDIRNWYQHVVPQYSKLDVSVKAKENNTGEVRIKFKDIQDLKRILNIA